MKGLTLAFNLAVFAVLIWVGSRTVPTWIAQWELEGQTVGPVHVQDLDGKTVSLPKRKGPFLMIFWATWCTPCRLELSRFASAVESGDLDPSRIAAVSIGEHIETVRKTARDRHYPFPVYADPSHHAASLFDVEVTPTVVHLNADRSILRISSGVSPLGIWRAESFIPGGGNSH